MKDLDKVKKLEFNLHNQPRQSIVSIFSTASITSASELTEEAIEAWKNLPEEIRYDPSLVNFRKKFEELNGETSGEFSNGISFNKESGKFPPNRQVSVMSHDSVDGIDSEDPLHPIGHHHQNKYVKNIKIFILISCWVMFTFFLMTNDEKEFGFRHLSISEGKTRSYVLQDIPTNPRVKLIFEGTFETEYHNDRAKDFLYYYLSLVSNEQSRNISKLYKLGLEEHSELDHIEMSKRSETIYLDDSDFEIIKENKSRLVLNLYTDFADSFPASVAYDPSPLNKDVGIILAAVVLLGLYVLIVFELVHRTLAAMVAAAMAIGILAVMNERPTMDDIILWIDAETLLLLFGMMILVAILSQTGLFDYLAVYAFKITKGRVWPLIICLCLFTAILSSVLDNVTTILLMTPVTIRLCEVMELNPVPILLFSVIYSNIGGTLTPVGDPPNVIITSNSFISKSGVTFLNFTMHMAIPVILVMVQGYFQLRFMYRDMKKLRSDEPKAVRELRHELTVWERAAATLSSCSKDEDILRKTLEKKVKKLNRKLQKKIDSPVEVPAGTYEATLADLEAKYAIKDKPLLWKSCVTLTIVIVFFFLHSFPEIQKLSLGWTALLGAILLLVLYDREDLDAILSHVEWSTLLFFAALFILMEALSELGLINFIGQQTERVILSVGEDARLAVAILIILWVSALASAFVDNIPLTTMMIKIVIDLSENEALGLPLQPLVWSLALGACLGGNGTLIGASANVVCAGVAEQHGYKFTFNQFFKVGFPIMMGSIVVSTAYLMVAHVALEWH